MIGAVAGVDGTAPIKAVFIDPFKGVLALFLLELGLVAGARLAVVKRFGAASDRDRHWGCLRWCHSPARRSAGRWGCRSAASRS